ncbi:MAG TPA: DUF554 domain-containing protein [Candidatus Nanoarchaeia archaeon]|nr:DUF554 domain-containing protein [Candidatus Nanoarchaeia archaeon]
MLGTLINTGAVIIGSILGLLIHKKFPKNIITIAFQAIGLFTITIGISMAITTENWLLLIFSIIIGSIIGELLNLEERLNKFSNYIKKKLGSTDNTFSEGLTTAFLLYCMGSMTILGAIQEGIGGTSELLLAKSLLDGFSSIALAATLGIGVLFSAIPLLIYQGGLTLFASSLQQFLTPLLITALSGLGGILLLGLGINILEIKKLKILNMLPSLIVIVLLTYFFG